MAFFEQAHNRKVVPLRINGKNQPIANDATIEVIKIVQNEQFIMPALQAWRTSSWLLRWQMKPFQLGAQYCYLEVGSDSDLFDAESFSPSATLIVVEDEDEAVAIANSSAYDLAGAIWTNEVVKWIALSKRLECGLISINAGTTLDLPLGNGMKGSGWGVENGSAGVRALFTLKGVVYVSPGVTVMKSAVYHLAVDDSVDVNHWPQKNDLRGYQVVAVRLQRQAKESTELFERLGATCNLQCYNWGMKLRTIY
ncbi:Aldehyde/histidinol dehydrogenase [Xylariaceae sp. FL1272]|nr:Aldehyde/histidinol dehydrogenase [Xylariaceae sp. FL1272]